jgi:hypothetical protein
MKRLIKKNNEDQKFNKGDEVKFTNRNDDVIYEVKEVLPDGSVFIDSKNKAHTNVNEHSIELIEPKREEPEQNQINNEPQEIPLNNPEDEM